MEISDRKIGDTIQLVGDDLFVTQEKNLEKESLIVIANSILVKVNQVGSVSETINTMTLAKVTIHQLFRIDRARLKIHL